MKGQKTKYKSFLRITDAKMWVTDQESMLRNKVNFPNQQSHKYTVSDMIQRYLVDELPKRRSDKQKFKTHLAWWEKELGFSYLTDLSPSDIAKCRDKLLQESNGRFYPDGEEQLKSPCTVVKYLATLSIVFSVAAKEWEWINRSPMENVRKPQVRNERYRYLSDDERIALLKACKNQKEYASYHPEWLYNLVVLRLCTGLRPNEGRMLKWNDIDLSEGIAFIRDTKNNEPLTVPLSDEVMIILKDMHEKRRYNTDWLFPRKDGKEPLDFRKRFYKALEDAKIKDFKFHDLRHTTASYLAMGGASLREIAEILNHKSLQMTKRYAHLSHEHTRKVLNKLDKSMFG